MLQLTGPQQRVLLALATAKGPYNRTMLAERVFNGNSVNFVPILSPLCEYGLVRQEELESDTGILTVFGITKEGREQVEVIKRGAPIAQPAVPPPTINRRDLQVGDVITKDYGGAQHEVRVREEGFEYDGQTYTSLSACAKAVRKSSSEVNGWLFFGLA